MSQLEIVAVEGQNRRGSLTEWADALSTHLGRVTPALRDQEETLCVPTSQQSFSGRIETRALGGVVLSKLAATPVHHSRSLRTSSPTIPVPVLLMMITSGSCRFDQRDLSCTLNPGDWCILDTRHPLDSWILGTGAELLVLGLEAPSDPHLRELIERGIARRWDGKTGVSRILQSTLLETSRQVDRLEASSASSLQTAITAMTWGALREQLDRPYRLTHQDLQRARIKRYIESQLTDPGLSVDSIALACAMSVRSVHRAFAADPSGSASRYIWLRRLSHCAASLRDPRQAHRPITDICFSWGFNSTSHFSRLFKDEFGIPPRDYRPAVPGDIGAADLAAIAVSSGSGTGTQGLAL